MVPSGFRGSRRATFKTKLKAPPLTRTLLPGDSMIVAFYPNDMESQLPDKGYQSCVSRCCQCSFLLATRLGHMRMKMNGQVEPASAAVGGGGGATGGGEGGVESSADPGADMLRRTHVPSTMPTSLDLHSVGAGGRSSMIMPSSAAGRLTGLGGAAGMTKRASEADLAGGGGGRGGGDPNNAADWSVFASACVGGGSVASGSGLMGDLDGPSPANSVPVVPTSGRSSELPGLLQTRRGTKQVRRGGWL